jgi:hypothetical protein
VSERAFGRLDRSSADNGNDDHFFLLTSGSEGVETP